MIRIASWFGFLLAVMLCTPKIATGANYSGSIGNPIINATVYGYSSTVDQCDSDPFTTASGQRARDGIVANNCLPFGKEVAIYSGRLSNGV